MTLRLAWLAQGCAVALLPAITAARGGPGSAFGEPLRLTDTAWVMAMSGALAASAEGVNAVALNPAGVLDTGLATFHLTHVEFVEGIGEEYAAFAQRLPLGGAVGVGVHVLHAPPQPRTLEDPITGAYAGSSGEFAGSFASGGAAYAVDLARYLPWLRGLKPAAGADVRAVRQELDGDRITGYTTDVGVRLALPGGFLAGGVLQNAGVAPGEAGLPLQWVTGLAWRRAGLAAAGDALTAEVDTAVAVDRPLFVKTGAEYRARAGALMLAVRAGWKQENRSAGAPGVTAGLGFRWMAARSPWGLDYAWVPWGAFGGVHAVSATLGLVPRVVAAESPPAEHETPPAPVLAFYPLRGEKARFTVRPTGPAELSAVLQDSEGNILMTLYERRTVAPGEVEIVWDGVLPTGGLAPFETKYRLVIQLGDQTYYEDVIPRKD